MIDIIIALFLLLIILIEFIFARSDYLEAHKARLREEKLLEDTIKKFKENENNERL